MLRKEVVFHNLTYELGISGVLNIHCKAFLITDFITRRAVAVLSLSCLSGSLDPLVCVISVTDDCSRLN